MPESDTPTSYDGYSDSAPPADDRLGNTRRREYAGRRRQNRVYPMFLSFPSIYRSAGTPTQLYESLSRGRRSSRCGCFKGTSECSSRGAIGSHIFSGTNERDLVADRQARSRACRPVIQRGTRPPQARTSSAANFPGRGPRPSRPPPAATSVRRELRRLPTPPGRGRTGRRPRRSRARGPRAARQA